jgi:hypothetical protein
VAETSKIPQNIAMCPLPRNTNKFANIVGTRHVINASGEMAKTMKTQYFLTRNVSRLWYETCEAYEKEDCAVKKFCSLGVLAAITKRHRTRPSSSSEHVNVCETSASCICSRFAMSRIAFGGTHDILCTVHLLHNRIPHAGTSDSVLLC